MPTEQNWRKKLSDKMERNLAHKLGAKAQPGSGNQTFNKGDVKAKVFLIEAKLTLNKSYSIKANDLAAIEEKALKKGLVPALVFEFSGLRQQYALVPVHVMEDYEKRFG